MGGVMEGEMGGVKGGKGGVKEMGGVKGGKGDWMGE